MCVFSSGEMEERECYDESAAFFLCFGKTLNTRREGVPFQNRTNFANFFASKVSLRW